VRQFGHALHIFYRYLRSHSSLFPIPGDSLLAFKTFSPLTTAASPKIKYTALPG
jgi:hypothetical protein